MRVSLPLHMVVVHARTHAHVRTCDSRNRTLTLFSASAGHGLNQSMVQQLMSEGYWRQRARKDSPTADGRVRACM